MLDYNRILCFSILPASYTDWQKKRCTFSLPTVLTETEKSDSLLSSLTLFSSLLDSMVLFDTITFVGYAWRDDVIC